MALEGLKVGDKIAIMSLGKVCRRSEVRKMTGRHITDELGRNWRIAASGSPKEA